MSAASPIGAGQAPLVLAELALLQEKKPSSSGKAGGGTPTSGAVAKTSQNDDLFDCILHIVNQARNCMVSYDTARRYPH